MKQNTPSAHRRKRVRPPPRRSARRGGREPRYGVDLAIQMTVHRGPLARQTRRMTYRRVGRRPPSGGASSVLARALARHDCAGVLAALGHPRRIALLAAILQGRSSHADLTRSVRLAVGPLYFHLGRLERVGLIRQPERNRNEATEQARFLCAALGLIMSKWNAGTNRPNRSR